MGKPNRTPLDKETGEKLLALFQSRSEWKPTEIPYEEIASLGFVRPNETVSVWISGSSSNPQLVHFVNNVVAGIDVLTRETKPNPQKNEPEGNAYHYFMQKINHEQYPFILYGPIQGGTIAPHWFDYGDLDLYPKD